MKRLLLFRHGKSAWDSDALTDHDRPLAPRGERAARTMGGLLATLGLVPNLVVSSSARRARATAELAVTAGGWSCPIEVTDALYDSSPGLVLTLVQGTAQDVGSLMLVGHEPVWSMVVQVLTGGRVRMVTGSVAGIDVAGDGWRAAEPGAGELAFFLPPRPFDGVGIDRP